MFKGDVDNRIRGKLGASLLNNIGGLPPPLKKGKKKNGSRGFFPPRVMTADRQKHSFFVCLRENDDHIAAQRAVNASLLMAPKLITVGKFTTLVG